MWNTKAAAGMLAPGGGRQACLGIKTLTSAAETDEKPVFQVKRTVTGPLIDPDSVNVLTSSSKPKVWNVIVREFVRHQHLYSYARWW